VTIVLFEAIFLPEKQHLFDNLVSDYRYGNRCTIITYCMLFRLASGKND